MAGSALEHVRSLAFPRFTGGEGEKRAAEYIVKQCRESGIEPMLQEYRAWRFPDMYFVKILIILWGLSLFTALHIFRWQPEITLALLIATAFSVSVLSRWHRCFEKLFDVPLGNLVSSQNIHAALGNDGSLPTIIFMAHYDSKSQFLPIYLRALIVICGNIGIALIALMSILRLYGAGAYRNLIDTVMTVGVILTGAALVLMLFNDSVDASPGAMDNASGVAVLLALLRHFSVSRPRNLNVHFLFTGSEEIGLCGAVRFLQRHGSSYSRRNTCVINLDGVGGATKLLVVDRYGLPATMTSRRLGAEIRTLAAGMAVQVHRLPFLVGALWDHVVWASRGFEAVTLSIGGWDRATMLIHGPRDRVEHIVPESLQCAENIARAIVDGMDRQEMMRA